MLERVESEWDKIDRAPDPVAEVGKIAVVVTLEKEDERPEGELVEDPDFLAAEWQILNHLY